MTTWSPHAQPLVPGWVPPPGSARRLRAFTEADLVGRWALDFHTPRGLVPLAFALVDDLAAGAMAAAAELGLPGGIQARLVGCHLYLGVLPGEAPGAAAGQAPSGAASSTPDDSLPAELTTYALGFRRHWAALAAELSGDLDALDRVDLPALSDAELLTHWHRARRLHRRAWQVHFDVMYRLMTVHEHYLAVCARHGVAEVDATRMIEGETNGIGDADRAVRALADSARDGGFARILVRTPTTRVLAALRREPAAAAFVRDLARVQARYGRRTNSLFDLESAPWSVEATQLLALVRSALVAGPPRRSWGSADARALTEQVLAGASPAAANELEEAWRLAVAGNASWWNEEHNHVIDLRAHLPVADAAGEFARRRGLARPQALHLLAEEFEAMLRGELSWANVEDVVAERIAFTSACRSRRRELPAGLGSSVEVPDDVVFRQVMGVGRAGDQFGEETLQGYGVSPGVARGTVRVVSHAEDIVLLRQGDVLVCAATSPSWTPAFDRIAAAVCDGGGLLTHAAIISREYGVPCVCATMVGTTALHEGDVVEVDGTAGTVRLITRSPVRARQGAGA